MAKKQTIQVGEKFGRLTITGVAGRDKHQHRVYECLCDCGNTHHVTCSDLRKRTQSCGCLKSEKNRELKTVHGGSGSRLYQAWCNMKSRCTNPHTDSYIHYGLRGITVCQEWVYDFEAFRDWALSHGYDASLTLERIDVDSGYEPTNCTWIPSSEQPRNRTNTIYITMGRQVMPLSKLAEDHGIPYTTVYYRFKHSWPAAEIIRPMARC